MKLYTIFDVDAKKCGPVFTAVNDAICNRLIYTQYKDMPSHISSRMKVLELAEIDDNTGNLMVKDDHYEDGVCTLLSNPLFTIEDSQKFFAGDDLEGLKNDSQH